MAIRGIWAPDTLPQAGTNGSADGAGHAAVLYVDDDLFAASTGHLRATRRQRVSQRESTATTDLQTGRCQSAALMGAKPAAAHPSSNRLARRALPEASEVHDRGRRHCPGHYPNDPGHQSTRQYLYLLQLGQWFSSGTA